MFLHLPGYVLSFVGRQSVAITIPSASTMYTCSQWILFCLAAGGLVESIDVNFESAESIKSASGTIAYDMMTFYTGNNTGDTPGNLPPPYYWWEAGAMFMHMVDYYYCSLYRSERAMASPINH